MGAVIRVAKSLSTHKLSFSQADRLANNRIENLRS